MKKFGSTGAHPRCGLKKVEAPAEFFTIVDNDVCSMEISMQALGLYVYMKSKPEGWIFSVERIINKFKEAKRAKASQRGVQDTLKELEDLKLLNRQVTKNNWEYTLFSNAKLNTEPIAARDSNRTLKSKKTNPAKTQGPVETGSHTNPAKTQGGYPAKTQGLSNTILPSVISHQSSVSSAFETPPSLRSAEVFKGSADSQAHRAANAASEPSKADTGVVKFYPDSYEITTDLAAYVQSELTAEQLEVLQPLIGTAQVTDIYGVLESAVQGAIHVDHSVSVRRGKVPIGADVTSAVRQWLYRRYVPYGGRDLYTVIRRDLLLSSLDAVVKIYDYPDAKSANILGNMLLNQFPYETVSDVRDSLWEVPQSQRTRPSDLITHFYRSSSL